MPIVGDLAASALPRVDANTTENIPLQESITLLTLQRSMASSAGQHGGHVIALVDTSLGGAGYWLSYYPVSIDDCRAEGMASNCQIEQQFNTARYSQFIERPEEIIFHGMLAQAQFIGDCLVGLAFRGALHNFKFAFG